MEHSSTDQVRTGAAYEAGREATRDRLAAAAEHRRVELAGDLVLVFETADTVRTALEEQLRTERVSDHQRAAAEAAAFERLAGGERRLAATLFVDISDPVALADRLADLPGIAARVFLEVGGSRAPATAEDGDNSSGAFHLLFDIDPGQRSALLDGSAVAVVVDHPACRAAVDLNPDQVRAATTDLRR